jgi:hypothetical protein
MSFLEFVEDLVPFAGYLTRERRFPGGQGRIGGRLEEFLLADRRYNRSAGKSLASRIAFRGISGPP